MEVLDVLCHVASSLSNWSSYALVGLLCPENKESSQYLSQQNFLKSINDLLHKLLSIFFFFFWFGMSIFCGKLISPLLSANSQASSNMEISCSSFRELLLGRLYKVHQMRPSNDRNCLSRSYGGLKSEIKMQAASHSLQELSRRMPLNASFSLWWFSRNPSSFLACRFSASVSASIVRWFPSMCIVSVFLLFL